MIQRGSAWTVAALFAFCATMPSLSAQDPAALLQEARGLYERGRDQEALTKLNEVLATNPASEDAWNLRQAIEFQDWAAIAARGGQHEALVKRLFEIALPEARAKARDAEAIKGLIAATEADGFVQRQQALFKLVSEHGEYAVPQLLSRLESEDSLRRAAAMETLRRLGTEAVLPLVQGLDVLNDLGRAGAVTVLAQIGDARGLPYVALVAREAEGAPGLSAREALAARNLGGADPVRMHLELAERYYRRDIGVVDPFRQTFIAWGVADGQLVAREVPKDLYHLKLAEEVLYDLLAVVPDNAEGHVLLASVFLGQAVVAAAAGEESPTAPLSRGEEMAAALGARIVNEAVQKAMADGQADVAARGAALLGRMLDPSTVSAEGRSLFRALAEGEKVVRIHAAFAIAQAAHGSALPDVGSVVRVLGEALGEDATRTAIVIDDQDDSRNALTSALNARGWFAYGAASGPLGLAQVRNYPVEDLVIVRYDLKSSTAAAIVDQLRRDARTESTVIALVVNGDQLETAKGQFGDKVQAFVVAAAEMEAAEPGLRAAVAIDDADRAAGIAMAARAARTLAAMPASDSAPALSALMGTLKGADEVRIPALHAIGRIGAGDAMASVLAVFDDAAASEAVRAAAAVAAASICAKTGRLDPAFVTSLEGFLAGAADAGADTWKEVGRAIGIAPFDPATRAGLVTKLRGRLVIDTETE